MKLEANLIRNQQVEGSIPPAGSFFPITPGLAPSSIWLILLCNLAISFVLPVPRRI
jgi:hypothetical protein